MKSSAPITIEPYRIDNEVISLKRVDQSVNLNHICCSKFIEPLNAVARGELDNSRHRSRNAVITVTDLGVKDKSKLGNYEPFPREFRG